MKVITIIFMLLLLMSPLQLTANQCSTSNPIAEPPQFVWTHHPATAETEEYYSGTLEIGEANFSIGTDTITTRAYRQEGTAYSIPGPTISMSPGNKYVLRFKNTLPFAEKSAVHNVFKDPNISNVHTHGLHISGESPSDDVTRSFEGGFGGDFVYDIPADHMGGTYWYHAHHHGSTFLQVSGGAFGLMIIDDSQDQIPAHVASMQEKQLVLGFLDPSVAGTGGDSLIKGSLSPTWTVNGNVDGQVCLPANTWQHWRILMADRDAKPKTISIDEGCEVALLARDGVWRTQIPKELTTRSLTITGASRADLAVRCSADSAINIAGNKVADIITEGTTDTAAHPYAADGSSTWSANRPVYLKDLRGLSPVNNETVNMGARTINGAKYDHHVPNFVLDADSIQEWQIKGGQQHPFHLHIYHVQVIGDCGDYEDGEYYDVVAGNCKIRFDINQNNSSVYAGRTIMHCHILEHEDQGAMGWVNIIGGKAPPTFPQGAGFSEYYNWDGSSSSAPNAPSHLVLSQVTSSHIQLNWQDNSSNESQFVIERSVDGVSFNPLITVATNEVSYTDTGLAAETTYYYRVKATNANGDSAYSNSASATTQPVIQGTKVLVQSITVTTVSAGKGDKKGRATVIVSDDQGNLVANAVVTGQFSGSFSETLTSTATSSSGEAVLDTVNSAKGGVSVTFCVTSISHPALQDFSANPGEVCSSL